jgi:hypothetical protein
VKHPSKECRDNLNIIRIIPSTRGLLYVIIRVVYLRTSQYRRAEPYAPRRVQRERTSARLFLFTQGGEYSGVHILVGVRRESGIFDALQSWQLQHRFLRG